MFSINRGTSIDLDIIINYKISINNKIILHKISLYD